MNLHFLGRILVAMQFSVLVAIVALCPLYPLCARAEIPWA